MADEAVRAPALGGVTERLDAQYDAHGADDDDVPITRSEGAKHDLCAEVGRAAAPLLPSSPRRLANNKVVCAKQ